MVFPMVHPCGSPLWFTVVLHRCASPWWFTVVVRRCSPRQAIRLCELARYELGLTISPALVLRCGDVDMLASALEAEGQQERGRGLVGWLAVGPVL